MVEKLKGLGGSRKFWAGLLGVALTYANSQVHILDDTQMAAVAGLLASWIIGQGVVDAATAAK